MKTKAINEVLLEFPSRSSNEGFARAAVACFAAQMDPTLNELEDMKTAAGHIFAVHLKETKPGVYRDMNFGCGGHTEYERCIRASLDMGVRMFTGEFWHQEGQDYRKVIADAGAFLRDKIETAGSDT